MGAYSVGVHGKGEISLEEILRRVKENPELGEAGAIACFIGIVRCRGLRGGRVRRLVFEAYREEAEKGLEHIARELLERPGIMDIRIHHVTGELSVGEDIVYIVVAGAHREEVFKTLRDAVERMKREVAIWKKEITDEGEYWVSGE
jgi:molybdopterin synthase catalytic subunit